MKNFCVRLNILFLMAWPSAILFAQPHRNPVPKVAVTTYHYDFMRTGWNSHEEILNPTLSPPGPISGPFGLLKVVALDDTVYAQPLIAPDVTIAGNKHDVVYVVTENNTVFAIDAYTGTVLLTRHLGPAVPRPRGCANNGDRVGIESTPVIDLDHHAMYLMSYTVVLSRSTYLLHAIDLSTLADQVPPVTASASHKLADGSTFSFNAAAQRQRAALLLADGNIYAAFASWCDDLGIQPFSRGWLWDGMLLILVRCPKTFWSIVYRDLTSRRFGCLVLASPQWPAIFISPPVTLLMVPMTRTTIYLRVS